MHSGPYFFTKFVLQCHLKTIIWPTLVSKSTFDSHDHINMTCAIIQPLFGQNKL